ncbi:MAG: hypothetical protein WAT16_08760, partial [Saprospiraceae bacterium]
MFLPFLDIVPVISKEEAIEAKANEVYECYKAQTQDMYKLLKKFLAIIYDKEKLGECSVYADADFNFIISIKSVNWNKSIIICFEDGEAIALYSGYSQKLMQDFVKEEGDEGFE